ncbi:MAG: DUF6265 family protein [Chitinophagaceae bacterium]|jgi:hypothetical protein|nr:hypothetical protein [Chitinophagaceae bacterium]MBP9740009.1 hypothetical protein [Chitinophagaceae bacterium]
MKYFVFLMLLTTSFAIQTRQLNNTLSQLQGKWQMYKNKNIIIEEWGKFSNTSITGKSYRIQVSKDTVNLETMQLKIVNGKTYFIPITANQTNEKPVMFQLTKSANNKFEFVNLKHDYPKRIVYHFINKDSIHAWIDDNHDNTEYRIDFYYSRAK